MNDRLIDNDNDDDGREKAQNELQLDILPPELALETSRALQEGDRVSLEIL